MFETVASTDGRAGQADGIQYQLGSGPCVDAIRDQTVYRTGDLAHDSRWPEYSDRREAFGQDAEAIGTVLATYGALAVSAATSRETVANLRAALDSNREIGVAMGILMTTLKIPREEAFGLLRVVSSTPTANYVTSPPRSPAPAPWNYPHATPTAGRAAALHECAGTRRTP